MRIYTVWNYHDNLKFVTTSEDQAKAYKTELFNSEHEDSFIAFYEDFFGICKETKLPWVVFEGTIQYMNGPQKVRLANLIGNSINGDEIIFNKVHHFNEVDDCYKVFVFAKNAQEAKKIGFDMIREYRAKEMGLSV